MTGQSPEPKRTPRPERRSHIFDAELNMMIALDGSIAAAAKPSDNN